MAKRIGVVCADFSPQSRVTAMHGWSIPAQGKDFEVKERDIIETAITNVDGGELISDVRSKVMKIPASMPGSIIGYEIEQEMQPYAMTDEWDIQDTLPVREARYTVRLPPDWSYKVFWLNHAESRADGSRAGTMALGRHGPEAREDRAADAAVARHRRAHGAVTAAARWQGRRVSKLAGGRHLVPRTHRRAARSFAAASAEGAGAHRAGAADPLSKMRALAAFVQKDIRYVAIELGVGGVQPHPASEVLDAWLRRLQGQSDPALLDAEGDRRRVSLRAHQHRARLRGGGHAAETRIQSRDPRDPASGRRRCRAVAGVDRAQDARTRVVLRSRRTR